MPTFPGLRQTTKLQVTNDLVAIFIAVPGPSHKLNAACEFRAGKSTIRVVEPAEVAERHLVYRIADPDHGAAAVLVRSLLPLQHDLLL